MSRLYIRWQSFLVRKNNIPLYVYITFYLLLYPLIDIWDAWLLWILLLWQWVRKFSFETTFSIYTQNWDCCIIWQFYFFNLWKKWYYFLEWLHPSQSHSKDSTFSASSPTLAIFYFCFFFIIVVFDSGYPMGMRRYFIIFILYFSIVIDVEHLLICCCSVGRFCLTLQPHGLQHARLPCFSLSPGVCPNSCSLSQWCHPTISSSVASFSSCHQSFLASGSFPMSWLFISGEQLIGASASASVLPMNIQYWYPLGLTSLISLQSKGVSRVFSTTNIWKHHFSDIQQSLWSNSHIHILQPHGL